MRTSRYLPASLVACYGLALLAVAYPGWMSTDSLWQWEQAAGYAPLNDWHAPILSWLWRMLLPTVLGPGLVVTLQVTAYFVGLALVVYALDRAAARWFLFAAALCSPVLLTIGWVWKDAFQLATISLSTGLLVTVPRLSGVVRRSALVAALALGALCALGRPYLVAAVALWLVAVAAAAMPQWRARTLALVGVGVTAGAVAAQVVAGAMLNPVHEYSSASIKYLDMARIECPKRDVQDVTPPSGVIPRSRIANGGNGDICENFSPYKWDGLYPLQPATGLKRPTIIVPTSAAESAALTAEWIEVLQGHPTELAFVRLRMAKRLLLTSVNPLPPRSATANVRNNARVKSVDWKWNRNLTQGPTAVAVAVVTAPSTWVNSLGDPLRAPVVPVVALPILAAIATARARRFQVRSALLLWAAPLVWIGMMVAVAPAVDTRYVAVACLLGILTAALVSSPLHASWPRDDSNIRHAV